MRAKSCAMLLCIIACIIGIGMKLTVIGFVGWIVWHFIAKYW